jgi:hypothetical protein
MTRHVVTTLAASAVALVIGASFGYQLGHSFSDRAQYNLSVQDGRNILAEVRAASSATGKVRELLQQISHEQEPSPASVAALLAVRRPVEDTLFRQRHYLAFDPGIVDNLLRYYMGVVFTWDRLSGLKDLGAELESANPDVREHARSNMKSAVDDLLANVVQIAQIETALVDQLSLVAALPER